MAWTKYLALPKEITPFEQQYLKRLNKVALVFFYLHVPAFMVVAAVAGTGPYLALGMTLAVIAGPTIAYRAFSNPRALSVVYGVTAMLMGGLLVHFGQGPVQIEMHFYFFALLAMLCMFANPTVNIAAAITVALHHLVVWMLVPGSVFNYDARWWVVLVHAGFVVLETVATCFISREFFDNVIGLEKIVDARTKTLNEKQRDMRLLLDTIEEGLITIDLYGRMSSECSQAAHEWFGAPAAGEKLSTWIGTRDATFGEWLELSLESVRDGMLPVEVSLSQLPKQFVDGDRTFAVHYKLVSNADAAEAEQILVVVTDITDRLRTEFAERHQSELLRLFQHIMRDKAGFVEFLTEADEIVHALAERRYGDLDHMKRLIHTLKGNAAMFGMLRLNEICHNLESWIADEATEPAASDMAGLHETWRRTRDEVQEMIGEHASGSIEIDDAEYQAILQAVLDGVDARLIARMLESWRLEPAGKRLSRIEQQIKGLAERMGKSNVSVTIDANDLRFNAARFAPFWSAFIHVLRNTVDHGIEDFDARQASGKPTQSTIGVSTRVAGDRFIVTVEDDGPGVDWDALRATAQQLGLASDPRAQSTDVIFLPGVSSKTGVTELSGRGVGMAAVRSACESLGGSVEVESRKGEGTRISFVFPNDDTVYEGHSAILRRASA
ncbi:MAG TPA: ATP-binding protein [Gemmatimonadaceae bacterium]|nr:ATP-binding protein [Gemmatimonadaceae bacterium]